MKKLLLINLFLLAASVTLFAQDYKVQSIEYLPDVLKAQLDQRTERLNSGRKCAVLQIATQNISIEDRSSFDFTSDLGSFIPEKRIENSLWMLWVSPGITYLTIHSNLGDLDIYFPDYLPDEIESLKTYRITVVGTKQVSIPPTVSTGSSGYGSCKIVFIPTPNDAVIYLNGDSLVGTGNRTVPTHPGANNWTVEHPLFHSAEGSIELTKGKTDTLYINLDPAYGYMEIREDYKMNENEELSVYLDGVLKGKVPYKSEKLAQGVYEVTLKAGDTIKALSQIEVKEHFVSINRADELCWNYEKTRTSIDNPDFETDSSFIAKPTRFYPITGKLTINSIPQSTISIDSIDYGLTPVTLDNLSVGSHRIELSAANYTPLIQEINVEEEKETPYLFNLSHSCFATIITDQEGDRVYIDSVFVGETPVTIERPYGTYSVLISRLGQNIEEGKITLTSDNLEPTFDFSFGQTVNVESGDHRAKLYVDNEYICRAPNAVYILNGQHTLRAERGWAVGEQDIFISRDNPIGNINIETHTQSPTSFLSNGAFFFTGNLGFLNKGGKTVYGFNIGDICKGGQAGWYLSLMTNTDFISQLYNEDYSVLDANLRADEAGNVIYGSTHSYTGERSLIRASALFGVALKIAGPVYLRIGGGYGLRRSAWKNTEKSWVIIDPVSWQDFEGSLGLQCCIYNFVINADALIPVQEVLTNYKKVVEFRVGFGFCLKHKKRN